MGTMKRVAPAIPCTVTHCTGTMKKHHHELLGEQAWVCNKCGVWWIGE